MSLKTYILLADPILASESPTETAQLLPVAIIKKELMVYWLQRLKDLHIQPSVLTSASFGLPFNEKEWPALFKCTWRHSAYRLIYRL